MRHLRRQIIAAAAASLVVFGGTAFAVSPNANAHAQQGDTAAETPATKAKPDNTTRQAAAAEKREARLAENALKLCQKREKRINAIMARTVDRATKQTEVFDKIATRTKEFYTSKGRTVANYDALVAAVDAAKQKTETDLAAMKAESTFKCDSANPKGSATAFKDNLKLAIADLKAYKTAVKNLIVGVKSAQGVTSSGRESSSPKPSASVSPSPSVSPSVSPSASPTPSATPATNTGAN